MSTPVHVPFVNDRRGVLLRWMQALAERDSDLWSVRAGLDVDGTGLLDEIRTLPGMSVSAGVLMVVDDRTGTTTRDVFLTQVAWTHLMVTLPPQSALLLALLAGEEAFAAGAQVARFTLPDGASSLWEGNFGTGYTLATVRLSPGDGFVAPTDLNSLYGAIGAAIPGDVTIHDGELLGASLGAVQGGLVFDVSPQGPRLLMSARLFTAARLAIPIDSHLASARPLGVHGIYEVDAASVAELESLVARMVEEGLLDPALAVRTTGFVEPSTMADLYQIVRAHVSESEVALPVVNPIALHGDSLQDLRTSVVQAVAAELASSAGTWRKLDTLIASMAPGAEWVALPGGAGAMPEWRQWEQGDALLRKVFEDGAQVRRTLVARSLSGVLDAPLAAGEVLEIRVGEGRVYSTAVAADGAQLVVNGANWWLELPASLPNDPPPHVTVTQVSAEGARRPIESYGVVLDAGSDSVLVARGVAQQWLAQGSLGLTQAFGAALDALLGRSLTDNTGRMDLTPIIAVLQLPDVAAVLQAQGVVLPTVVSEPPALGAGVAEAVARAGQIWQEGSQVWASRESVGAWVAEMRDGGQYVVAPAMPSSTQVTARPVVALEDTERSELQARLASLQTLKARLVPSELSPLLAPAQVALGVEVDGALRPWTVEISTDGGGTWAVATSAALEASGGNRLVRVLVPEGEDLGSARSLSLRADATGAAYWSGALTETVRISHPGRTQLSVVAEASASSATFSAFTVTLSHPLDQPLEIGLALQALRDGTQDSPDLVTSFLYSSDGGATWLPVTGTQLVIAAGTRSVLVGTALPLGQLPADWTAVRLGLQAGGLAADSIDQLNVSGSSERLRVTEPSVSVTGGSVGQGEGWVVFQVSSRADAGADPSRSLALDFDVGAIGIDRYEYSLDLGVTWVALGVVDGLAHLNWTTRNSQLQVRGRVVSMPDGALNADVALTASLQEGDQVLASGEGAVKVWTHGATPALWVDDIVWSEGGDAGTTAVFTIQLSGPSDVPVQVDFHIAGGMPGPFEDHVPQSGRLLFAAGETRKTVSMVTLDREQWSGGRTFELQLANAINASLETDRATATIQVLPPQVELTSVTVDEAVDTHAVFSVGLSRPAFLGLDLQLTLRGGSAAAGADWIDALEVWDTQSQTWMTLTNGLLHVQDGQSQALVRVALVQRESGASERGEQFHLEAAPSAQALGSGLVQAHIAKASALLRGNVIDIGLTASQPVIESGARSVTFELGVVGNGWIDLQASAGELGQWLDEAGLSSINEASLVRHIRGSDGALHPVVSTDFITQLNAAVALGISAAQTRLLQDSLLSSAAGHADHDATDPALADWLSLGEPGAAKALLAAVKAAGMASYSDVPASADADALTRLGQAVLQNVNGVQEVFVSRETFNLWTTSLQRTHEREQALASRAQLGVLWNEEGGPVLMGESLADGTGAGDRWLQSLYDAGVVPATVVDGVLAPDALGKVFRTKGADGVERLYASNDTLDLWGMQLRTVASLATSRANGGTADFARQYLDDRDTQGITLRANKVDLGKIRLEYAVLTLMRNAYWLSKDISLERIRQYANNMTTSFVDLEAKLNVFERFDVNSLSFQTMREQHDAFMGLLDIHTPSITSKPEVKAAYAQARARLVTAYGFLDEHLQGQEFPEASQQLGVYRLAAQAAVDASQKNVPDTEIVNLLNRKAAFQEFAKEADQVGRFFSAVLAIAAVMPAAILANARLDPQQDGLQMAYNGLTATQIVLQALHMPWWFIGSVIDNKLNAEHVMQRNTQLFERTMRAYFGGKNVGAAMLAIGSPDGHIGMEKKVRVEAVASRTFRFMHHGGWYSVNLAQTGDNRVLQGELEINNNLFRVRLLDEAGGEIVDGRMTQTADFDLYRIDILADGSVIETRNYSSGQFELQYMAMGWGFPTDKKGRAIGSNGRAIDAVSMGVWNSLSDAQKDRITPEDVALARKALIALDAKGALEYRWISEGQGGERPARVLEDLARGEAFGESPQADAHFAALNKLITEVDAWGVGPAGLNGKAAIALANGKDTYAGTVSPGDPMQLYIEGMTKTKSVYQEIFTSLKNGAASFEGFFRSFGSGADTVENLNIALDEIGVAHTAGPPGNLSLQNERRLAKRLARAPHLQDGDIPSQSLVDDSTFLALVGKRNTKITRSPDGALVVTEMPFPIREEPASFLDKDGNPVVESKLGIGPYKDGKWWYTGRYAALLGSDLVGVFASGVGMAYAVQQYKAIDGSNLSEREKQVERTRLEAEMARQAMFLGSYALLGVSHASLAMTAIPLSAAIAAGADTVRAITHGMGVLGSMVGSGIVLASDAANLGAYARRWEQASHWSGTAVPQEYVYGTLGTTANVLVEAAVLAAPFLAPTLAPLAGLLPLVLPNWAAIGRGRDLERRADQLRAAGRDREADLTITMASASYSDAAPIYSWFSSTYTPERVVFQLNEGPAMRGLLDTTGTTLDTLSTNPNIGLTYEDVGYMRRYRAFLSPGDLFVPLNPYLSGDGGQIDWDHVHPGDLAFQNMSTQSAARMKAQMLAQSESHLSTSWFGEAFEDRVRAQALHWQDPFAAAAQRKNTLTDEANFLREKAFEQYGIYDGGSTSNWNDLKMQIEAAFVQGAPVHVQGTKVYKGPHLLGDVKVWQTQAEEGWAQTIAQTRESSIARLYLSYYLDHVEQAELNAWTASIDITARNHGLSMADNLVDQLHESESTSDMFVIASRAEAFDLQREVYHRTMAYSNYSVHEEDRQPGNVEWVDGSYLLHVGRPDTDAQGRELWSSFVAPAVPQPPTLPLADASQSEVDAYNRALMTGYNQAVQVYNLRLREHFAALQGAGLPNDQRSPDAWVARPLEPLLPVSGPMDGSSPSLAYTAAQAHYQTVLGEHGDTLSARLDHLDARYTRVQNVLDAQGNATGESRFAISGALDPLGLRFDTRLSGNQSDDVDEVWKLTRDMLTRHEGEAVSGQQVHVVVRDENGNTNRRLLIDSSDIDDQGQRFDVLRANVKVVSGDGDDTFLLSTAQGIDIDSGAGANDQALMLFASEGQQIDVDRFKGVTRVVGSAFDDVVTGEDDEDRHYIWQFTSLSGAQGASEGDTVRLTGAGNHTVELGAGSVLTGAGEDWVVVHESVGGQLDIDTGAGEDLVSFAYLPGVDVKRDAASGDYTFDQVTRLLGDDDGTGVTYHAGLMEGEFRNAEAIIGSHVGDRFVLQGGIHALQAAGGDDRIDLLAGNVVVDGGEGNDEVDVRGALGTRILMDDAGDRVHVHAGVDQVMVAVGSRQQVGGTYGTGVLRGEIDARDSAGDLTVDVVDGTVKVYLGSGKTTINLLSTNARVEIIDSAARLDAQGTVTVNVAPDVPMDDLVLRTRLAQAHATLDATGRFSLDLGDMVSFVPVVATSSTTASTAGNTRSYHGVSLGVTNLAGQPVHVPLDGLVPQPVASAPADVQPVRENATGAAHLKAWAGVRTVLELPTEQILSGAYSEGQAAARSVTLQAKIDGASARLGASNATHDAIEAVLAAEAPSSDAAASEAKLALTTVAQWVGSGAQVDRLLMSAHHAVLGRTQPWGPLLLDQVLFPQTSADWRADVRAELAGVALYDPGLQVLRVDNTTFANWRMAFMQRYSVNPAAPELQALHEWFQLWGSAPDEGVLHPGVSESMQRLHELASLGIIAQDKRYIATGVDLQWVDGAVQSNVFTLGFDEVGTPHGQQVLAGLGFGWELEEGVSLADQLLTLLASPSTLNVLVVDPVDGQVRVTEGTLSGWSYEAGRSALIAQAEVRQSMAELATVDPYRLTKPDGSTLPDGITFDAESGRVEVAWALPAQAQLALHARHDDATMDAPVWVEVDFFDGITRVGTDGADVLTASGDRSNLLAGGRANDVYDVRDGDVVLENADEGYDTVRTTSISHELADNVEALRLTREPPASAGAAAPVLSGTGNALNNALHGSLSHANVLDGRSGADHLYGGYLDDTYHVDNAGDVVDESLDNPISGPPGTGLLIDKGGRDTVVSSINFSLVASANVLGWLEDLTLTGQSDLSATGNTLNNRLQGNAGANLINGGFGADWMAGALGDDSYWVDNAADTVVERAGEGFDTVRSSVSYTLSDEVESLILTGTTSINGTGNAQANQLKGSAGKNILDGGAENDTVMLAGRPEEYRFIRLSSGEMLVGDLVANRGSVDRWLNVEAVFFEGTGQTQAVVSLPSQPVLAYTASHPDLIAAFALDEAQAANHYVQSGYAEGRAITFDGLRYLASHADLMAQFGNNASQGTAHYISTGWAAGRSIDNSLVVQQAGAQGGRLDGQAGVNNGLFGGALADEIHGAAGSDGLYGGGGNDVLDGHGGADRMAGGMGNDKYFVDSGGDQVVELANQGVDEVIATVSYALPDQVENGTLAGAQHIDLTGNGINNNLQGNGRRNRIDGGGGVDTVLLDAPLAAYRFLRMQDGRVLMGPIDPLKGAADWLVNVEQVRVVDTGEVVKLADIKMPSVLEYIASHTDLMNAFGANEAAGADHYFNFGQAEGRPVIFDGMRYLASNPSVAMTVGTAADAATTHYITQGRQLGLLANPAFQIQVGNSLNNTLAGSLARDGLFGESGDDVLTGLGGDDALFGGKGRDVLDGGAGTDAMVGGEDDDLYRVDVSSDRVLELNGQGNDTVEYAGSGAYVLESAVEDLVLVGSNHSSGNGNSQRNKLTGNVGNNSLSGEAGDDDLLGGAGNDVLNGGVGLDKLWGGLGSDTYLFNRGDGRDEIREEQSDATSTDRLSFAFGGAQAVGFDQLWFQRSGNDLRAIVMGSNDFVDIKGWYLGAKIETITAANLQTTSQTDYRSVAASGVEQLVNAMASMAPPPSATGWGGLTASQQSQLNMLGVWS